MWQDSCQRQPLATWNPARGVWETGQQAICGALGAVLADLAEMGFDADWGSVRAADAGAPHRRERVFIVARDAESRGKRGSGRSNNPRTLARLDGQVVHLPYRTASRGQLARPAVKRSDYQSLPNAVAALTD